MYPDNLPFPSPDKSQAGLRSRKPETHVVAFVYDGNDLGPLRTHIKNPAYETVLLITTAFLLTPCLEPALMVRCDTSRIRPWQSLWRSRGCNYPLDLCNSKLPQDFSARQGQSVKEIAGRAPDAILHFLVRAPRFPQAPFELKIALTVVEIRFSIIGPVLQKCADSFQLHAEPGISPLVSYDATVRLKQEQDDSQYGSPPVFPVPLHNRL